MQDLTTQFNGRGSRALSSAIRPLQMKHTTMILATCLGFLTYPLSIHSTGTPSVQTLFVFKLDGTKHCESYAGVSLDSMALELAGAGIEVFSRRKGYDGREGIAVCGAPTGQINIYEIAPSDLSAALSLGFKQLPKNWIRPDSGNGGRPNPLQSDAAAELLRSASFLLASKPCRRLIRGKSVH